MLKLAALVCLLSLSPAAGSIRSLVGIVPNHGQFPAPVRCAGCCDIGTVYFTDTGVVIDFVESSCALGLQFEVDSPAGRIEPRKNRATRTSYFLRDNSSRWAPNLETYDELAYVNVWPGVDVVFRPEARALCYEILIGPTADPLAAQIRPVGAGRADKSTSGVVRISLAGVTLLDRPIDAGGTERWIQLDEAPPDSGCALDAGAILWGTFLGGSVNDYPHGVRFDPLGRLIVAGYTQSLNFPTTLGAHDRTEGGSYDLFVARFSPDGSSLDWATLIGGGWEGRPVLAGETSSIDFPTTPGVYDATPNGGMNDFTAKLDAGADSLLWSSYIAGSLNDYATRLIVEPLEQCVVLCGTTNSSNFPTTAGAFDRAHNGGDDCFLAALDSMAVSLGSITFLGGSGTETRVGLTTDASGGTLISGSTTSTSLPVTPGAFDSSWNRSKDIFAARFNTACMALSWSTLLGGSLSDEAFSMAVDPAGGVLLAGATSSADFPTRQRSRRARYCNQAGKDGMPPACTRVIHGGRAIAGSPQSMESRSCGRSGSIGQDHLQG